jgi:hypothetical protein
MKTLYKRFVKGTEKLHDVQLLGNRFADTGTWYGSLLSH